MQVAHTFDRKAVLGVSLELSCKTWRLALADERRPRPATATAAAPQPRRTSRATWRSGRSAPIGGDCARWR